MASIVEDARLRGVAFRGLGNEPPWILEIGPDAIVVHIGYESMKATFPLVEPITDPATHRSTWTSRSDNETSIQVVVVQPPDAARCLDTMADVSYEARVEITIGDRVLLGCGSTLR